MDSWYPQTQINQTWDFGADNDDLASESVSDSVSTGLDVILSNLDKDTRIISDIISINSDVNNMSDISITSDANNMSDIISINTDANNMSDISIINVIKNISDISLGLSSDTNNMSDVSNISIIFNTNFVEMANNTSGNAVVPLVTGTSHNLSGNDGMRWDGPPFSSDEVVSVMEKQNMFMEPTIMAAFCVVYSLIWITCVVGEYYS
jgi:hypothetical protein